MSRLGFDPLLALPPPRRFVELLAARSVVIKSLLLNQGFAAGVGNWIADEVLYQARIDPRRRARDLDEREAKRLRRVLGRVVKAAVAVDAESSRYPAGWLFHRRWGKQAEATTARGEAIRTHRDRRAHHRLGPRPSSAEGQCAIGRGLTPPPRGAAARRRAKRGGDWRASRSSLTRPLRVM